MIGRAVRAAVPFAGYFFVVNLAAALIACGVTLAIADAGRRPAEAQASH